MKASILIFLLSLFIASYGQSFQIKGEIFLNDSINVSRAQVYLAEQNRLQEIKGRNHFSFDSLSPGSYTITVFVTNYASLSKTITLDHADALIVFELNPLSKTIETVSITAEKQNNFGISRLKPVEGTAIYAGKKSEVITVDDLAANLATNNSRQIYSKVSGLNIWENDGAGIQLGIGGRGLNPNRVSNFNTRQNGYDISADALGYPESYYSPPAEAIDRIELVRGAASLQYGTQFGGFLNFKLKQAPRLDTFELVSRQTIGSYQLFNSFNSIGGNYKKWSYYTYYQYKTGEDWRPNSSFEVHNAHLNFSYQATTKLKLGMEYTFMNYLAQQAGGLTDFMFEQDPSQSIRERNWFGVDWNLMAFTLDYKLSDRTAFNFRGFGLVAGRDAVGNLSAITRLDIPNTPRDLLKDDYRNYGFENRLIHRYTIKTMTAIALIGMRYYNGYTERKQGDGSSGRSADFSFANPAMPEDSEYDFPSTNTALFFENIFYLNPHLSVTPGVRYEHISTAANGYYASRSFALNDALLNEDFIDEQRVNNRDFILGGIGVSYKPMEQFEVYTNFSQNYRSINFNDMRIDNPNYQVDPGLHDERGYSFDFGIRGNEKKGFNYDVSFFLLAYQNRIGNIQLIDPVLFKPIRYRTNISDSRSMGLESFVEADLLYLLGIKSESRLSIFSNLSIMDATYISSDESAIDGNKVELVPDLIFKTGLTYAIEQFQFNFLYSYTSEHFSDATNAVSAPNAVNGIIPEYAVMDISAKYAFKKLIAECGVNNLADERYFTRRAAGYPGPGIIPANPRTYYLTLGLKL